MSIHLLEAVGKQKWGCSVTCYPWWPHGLRPTRLLRPWDFPGKGTGVGCHFLLQGVFPTRGLNPSLPHCKQMLYPLSHQIIRKFMINIKERGFNWHQPDESFYWDFSLLLRFKVLCPCLQTLVILRLAGSLESGSSLLSAKIILSFKQTRSLEITITWLVENSK